MIIQNTPANRRCATFAEVMALNHEVAGVSQCRLQPAGSQSVPNITQRYAIVADYAWLVCLAHVNLAGSLCLCLTINQVL